MIFREEDVGGRERVTTDEERVAPSTDGSPPSDQTDNCVVHLKEQSIPEKGCKQRRNRTINGNAMLVQTMHPRTHGAPDSERDKQNKKLS